MNTPTLKPLSGPRTGSIAAVALLLVFLALTVLTSRVRADVLGISAGQVFHITWQATDPVGDATVSLYLDDDTDPSSGLVPIASGLASSVSSFDWVPDSSLVGKEYYIRAVIVDGGVTVGSYSMRKVHIEDVNSFNVQSPLQTTSPDYAYQYMYNGQVYTGVAPLVSGQNTITVTVTLPNGTTAKHQFNVSLVNSLLASQGYTYDEMQRIKTYTNGNGIVTTYNYDFGGRLVSTAASNGNAVFYTYDAGGRRLSMSDGSGYTFYDYDDLDRLTAVTTSKNSNKSDTSALKLQYGYDLADHRTSIIYPGGEQINYIYDNAGRMTGANNVTRNLNTTYEYNTTSGLLTAVNRANGIRTAYSYDGMGQLTEIRNSKGGALISDFSYILNAAGNATQLTVTNSGNVTQVEQYAYDDIDRLVQIIYSDGRQVNYTYDGEGNRLTATTHQNSTVTGIQNYRYGNENRLLGVTDQNGGLVASYAYDSAGNRIQMVTPQGTTSYSYDERNLLISVIAPGAHIFYAYDGTSHRVSRNDGKQVTIYTNDVNRAVYQTVQERDGSQVVNKTYTYGLDRLSTASITNGTVGIYLPDRIGTIRQSTDANGNATPLTSYDVFGSATQSGYSFAGEDCDTATGLVYLRSRYYDPQTGIFITKDVLGVTGGLNQYVYSGSNPVGRTDPNGEFAPLVTGAIGAGIGALVGGTVTYLETRNLGKSAAAAGIGAATGFAVGSGAAFIAALAGAGALSTTGAVVSTAVLSGTGSAVNNAANQAADQLIDHQSVNINGGKVATSFGIGLVLGAGGAAYSASVESSVAANEGDIGYSLYNLKLLNSSNLPQEFVDSAIAENAAIAATAQVNNFSAQVSDHALNDVLLPTFVEPTLDKVLGADSPAESVGHGTVNGQIGDFGDSTFNFGPVQNVGGVLLDKAATLVGTNLSDIQGATFDPVSSQIVFLGTNNSAAVADLNLDYFYTAVQAVYGSAVPPYVTLDPPAGAYSQWSDYGNGNGLFENGESAGFVLRYNPIWEGEDTNGGIDVRIRGTDSSGTIPFDFTQHFNAVDVTNITAGNRHPMLLTYGGVTSGSMPSGWSFNSSVFSTTSFGGGFSLSIGSQGQDTYYPFTFTNSSTTNYIINSTFVLPARQHRRYGGRVDGTKLGWVMYEADRVMKCLGVGKDNLTGAAYSSATVSVPGYKNLLERAQAANNTGGNIRFWFEPNQMNMQRYVDPTTGQATIMFSQASVILLTESYLQGLPQTPIATDFASFFTSNYDAFAALNFPVLDPTDPTSTHIINVPIFKYLKEGMQAVALARFFRDNNIPLDTWWLNSWQPPTAYSPKSVASAMNTSASGSTFYLLYGGVQISKPNTYTPSATAQSVGQVVAAARPDTTAAPGGDLKQQTWNASTAAGSLTAVASSFQASQQDASVNLNEVDLNFASPGALPLRFTRYYQSGYMAHQAFGPGWRYTRYTLQFSRPSWYDEQGLMTDATGNTLPKDSNSDTHLRSDALRLVDLSTGATLDFTSSMRVAYAINGLGNPTIAVSGLTTADVPTFSPGQRQDGTTLAQTPGNAYQYQAATPDGSMLFFDTQGRLLQTVDHNGYQQFYDYDANANLIDIRDNASQTLTVNYNTDGTGTIKSVTGPAGEEIDYAYDTPGRLASATHKRSGASTNYTYNISNQLVDTTHFDGIKPVVTTADLKGRSSLRDDYRGNTSSFTFYKNATTGLRSSMASVSGSSLAPTERDSDAADRVTSVKDPLNNWTLYGYSGTSLYPNSVQLPTPNRPAIQIQRNAIGQPTQITDPAVPNAQPTQLAYNSANLPYWQKDAMGRQTMLQYTTGTNNLSQVTRYLGGQSVTTNLGYQNGYVKTLTDPLTHSTTYNRDTVGRVTSVVDPTGVTLGYEYDTLGRLSKVTDPRLSSKIVYSYDNFDRVTDIALPAGTIHYDYDPATHRLSKVTDLQGRTTRYVYNATGDLVQTINDTSGGALATQYAYNRFGALNQVTPPGASAINFNVDDLGRVLGSSETNGAHLGTPKALTSNNAVSGVYTTHHTHVFTWGAPDSDVGVVGYSYAMDGAPGNTVNVTSGLALWSNVPDGQHTFSVKAKDSQGNWGDVATFNLWIDSRLTYQEWLASYFTPQEIAAGIITVENADPDGDGIPNLLEFALGTNPRVADVSGLPATQTVQVSGSNYLALQYRHRIGGTDITYLVETSTDLVNWNAVSISQNQVGSASALDDTMEQLVVRGNDPIAPGAKQSFIRLHVTHP